MRVSTFAPGMPREFLHRLIWLSLGAATFAVLADYYMRGIWPTIATGQLKIVDVSSFWAAGVRVLNGDAALIYDAQSHGAIQATLHHRAAPDGLAFPYPPHALLFFAPLGWLSYWQAWVTFLVPGIAIFYLIMRKISGDSLAALGMTFAVGGATHTVTLGQTGYYTASLLAGGLLLLPRNKTGAGLLFGFLTFKPHLGIALAFALLIWREWKAIAVAAGTAAALALIATAAFGFSIWGTYLTGNSALAAIVGAKQQTLIEPMMQSVFALTVPGAGWVGAGLVQAAVAAVALIMVWRVSRLTGDWAMRCAAVIAASLLMSPYLFLYDATVLAAAAALLLPRVRKAEQLGIFLALLLPGTWYLTLGSQVPIAAMLILAIAYLAAAYQTTQANLPAEGT